MSRANNRGMIKSYLGMIFYIAESSSVKNNPFNTLLSVEDTEFVDRLLPIKQRVPV